MCLYRHFAFRGWLAQHPEADEVEVTHLDESDHGGSATPPTASNPGNVAILSLKGCLRRDLEIYKFPFKQSKRNSPLHAIHDATHN